MAKEKKPIIEKNIEKFINNNFDKKDRKKDDSLKFEWFVNSMHIWQCSSQSFNSNTKIGKDVSLGTAQGGDAFFISINNFERIFSINSDIDETIEYVKKHAKFITFHFIQTKKTESISWPQFLNLIDIPLKIWKGLEFDKSQPILQKIQEFIDIITDEEDSILGKIEHKIEIVFYTNKDNHSILAIEKDWATNINNKKSELSTYFNAKDIMISIKGSELLNEIYEKINSNNYSLSITKNEVIEADEKKYLIGYMTARELLDAIAPVIGGNRTLYPDVFKNNIRLYLGQNEINRKIEETLLIEPKKFHFYNNGITITTKEILDHNSKNFIITPVNIVNGCQTANSIYNAYKTGNLNENDVKIPVKIIVAQDKEYEDITIRSNTQNGLEAKDLISITNIQIELEDLFLKNQFCDKSFYYKRQKSGIDVTDIDADFIIQIDDILRASFSTLLLIPNKVSGYFDQTTLKYIERIFDERFIKFYHTITILFKLIENETDETYVEFKRLNYHLLYVIYKLVNRGIDINSFETYFKEVDDLEPEDAENQDLIINQVVSNISKIITNKLSFKKIFDYVTNKIKNSYPELINIANKKDEKILYKPVEKLKRVRTSPVFDNFQSIFIDEIESIINSK